MRQRPIFTIAKPRHTTSSQRSLALASVPCAIALLCAHMGAQAQTAEPAAEAPLRLQASPILQDKPEPGDERRQPTFVFGDRITGRPDLDTIVEGNAELRRSDTILRADRIEYYQPDDLAKVRGNIRLNLGGNTYTGTEGQMKLESSEGYLNEPTYQFLKNGAYGQASRIDFIDDKRSVLRNATYTTCTRRPGPSWMPDWILKASQVEFDNDTQTGQAEDVQLRFKDVPLFSLPYLSFPLTDARKSGWLPPSINTDNTSGVELAVPYYWNIAPNRDATIYTSLLSKRGINVGTEFRYKEAQYDGTARLDVMPGDKLRSATRWGLTTAHTSSINTGLRAVGDLTLNLSLNRVSDDNYWRDFTRASGGLTQRLLSNDGTLSWAQGPFSASARVLKWQTLQSADSIITPPYDRLPQLTARFDRANWGAAGLDVQAEVDTTRFRSAEALTLQPNGARSYALAQVSKNWQLPGFFITPKLQLHGTSYQLDSALSNGKTAATRWVPTASIDSGLMYEREASYLGRSFVQTLEPRALYTFTPFRDQAQLPNYDTGLSDFNFASIYSTNKFVGNDRIADSNLLTVGVTSRLIEPATGAEAMRLAFAQRIRFSDQKVTLPGGTPDTTRLSDMLFGASVNWSPRWSSEAVVQFNPETKRSERSTLSGRYSPGNYRVLSGAYRYTRDQNEQVDFGWQWPLNDLWGDKGRDLGRGAGQGEGRWYSVGRLNYNLQDRKIVDAVLGFEYDAGCWLGRVVLDRVQTSSNTSNKRISFQLEFVGFTRLGVGTNPLRTLKENVPSYQYLREKITASPSRLSTYD
jgi:LPS-assembly protein